MSTNPDLLHAAREETIIAQWLDFTRWIDLRLALIKLRISAHSMDVADAFEAADTTETREAEITREIALILPERRNRFEHVLQPAREAAYAAVAEGLRAAGEFTRLPDPDLVEQQALRTLAERAQGIDGIGWVPMPDGDYEVDTAKLRDTAPDQAAFRLAGRTGNRRTALIGSGVLIVVMLGLIVLVSRPSTKTASIVATTQRVTVNNDRTEIEPWVPRALTVRRAEDAARVPVMAGDTTTAANGRAVWQSLWPPEVCLPSGQLSTVQELTAHGAIGVPDREYVLTSPGAAVADADLLVRVCGETTLRTATLRTVEPIAAQPIGTAITLHDGTQLTLTTIAVVGAGTNPELPQDKLQVLATVAVSATAPVNWGQLSAVLQLPDGTAQLPSNTDQVSGTAHLRYLAPTSAAGRRVTWDVTDGSQLLRWQVDLAAPADRIAFLRTVLRDVTVRVTHDALSDQPLLAITLTNASAQPLTMTDQDLRVSTTEGRSIATTIPDSFRTPLAPGETRTGEIPLPNTTRDPLLVTVGNVVASVSFP